MDAEMKRFLKSFSLHAERLMFYDEDYLAENAVVINNRAISALRKLTERVRTDPEKYSAVLHELLHDESPKKRWQAAEICLDSHVSIYRPEALETLIDLVDVKGMALGTIVSIGMTTGPLKMAEKLKDYYCIAPKRVYTEEFEIVYREEPDPNYDYPDSGLRLLIGDESDEYKSNPDNFQFVSVDTVFNSHTNWIIYVFLNVKQGEFWSRHKHKQIDPPENMIKIRAGSYNVNLPDPKFREELQEFSNKVKEKKAALKSQKS